MKNVVSYIGSKQKLLDYLDGVFKLDSKKEFVDLFAGTCSVSKYMCKKYGCDIIINDISFMSSILIDELSFNTLNKEKMINLLNEFDTLPLIDNGVIFNEFSMGGTPISITDSTMFNGQIETGRMFFPKNVGQKIDTIKTRLKELRDTKQLNEIEINFILTILLNFVNSNANITSVFGAYLKIKKRDKEYPFLDMDLINELLNLKTNYHSKYKKYQLKANECLDVCFKDSKHLKKDRIIYMDPPYNTRSYESNYHILEYILDLDFNPNIIKINSKTGIKIGKINNPFVSKKETKIIFKELIKSSLMYSNSIYISYNNEGVLKESEMNDIIHNLKNIYPHLELNTHYKEYKRFTSGENNNINTNTKKMVLELIWEISNKEINHD